MNPNPNPYPLPKRLPVRLPFDHYPDRLRALAHPPSELWVSRHVDFTQRAIAIIGTRESSRIANEFAADLARALVAAGIAVVSGGARGIDAAAHVAALEAGGNTWCVAPTGPGGLYPDEHKLLFQHISDSSGTMIWPFSRPRPFPGAFVARNRVLVALADAVVIVQAGIPSGALNAGMHARSLGRPVYACLGPSWTPSFAGCALEVSRGATPIESLSGLLADLGVGPKPRDHTTEESALLEAIGTTPLHLDEIAVKSGLSARGAATALLTLALEDVLVEGPEGFFRRVNST